MDPLLHEKYSKIAEINRKTGEYYYNRNKYYDQIDKNMRVWIIGAAMFPPAMLLFYPTVLISLIGASIADIPRQCLYLTVKHDFLASSLLIAAYKTPKFYNHLLNDDFYRNGNLKSEKELKNMLKPDYPFYF